MLRAPKTGKPLLPYNVFASFYTTFFTDEALEEEKKKIQSSPEYKKTSFGTKFFYAPYSVNESMDQNKSHDQDCGEQVEKTDDNPDITSHPFGSIVFPEIDLSFLNIKDRETWETLEDYHDRIISMMLKGKLKSDIDYSLLKDMNVLADAEKSYAERARILNKITSSKISAVTQYHDIKPLKEFICHTITLNEGEYDSQIAIIKHGLGEQELSVGCSSINIAIIAALKNLKDKGVPILTDWDSRFHIDHWKRINNYSPDFIFSTEGTYHLTGMVKYQIFGYKPILPISGIEHRIIYRRNPDTPHIQPNAFKLLYLLMDSSAHAEELILHDAYARHFREIRRFTDFDELVNIFTKFEEMDYDCAINMWEPLASYILFRHPDLAAVFRFPETKQKSYINIVNLMAKDIWLDDRRDPVRHAFLKILIHELNKISVAPPEVIEELYKAIPHAFSRFKEAFVGEQFSCNGGFNLKYETA